MTEQTLETKPVFVACYGSLRSLMGNHRVNAMAGGTVVGLGRTKDNYDLFAYCSGFPSVSLEHSDNGLPVRVEVYETTEAGLTGPYDRLEGYPNFYNRTLIPVVLDDGSEVGCYIYHIDQVSGPLVENNDWCLRKYGPNYYEDLANAT